MRNIGTVVFYDARKSFGFIRPDDGGRDVFLGGVAVSESGLPIPATGERLEYDVVPDDGMRARAVNLERAA